MERLNRQTLTLVTLTAACLVLTASASLLFIPTWKSTAGEAAKARLFIAEAKEILARKQALEAEWAGKKTYWNSNLSAEELRNAWIKELLAYAQTQSFKVDKIEPVGTREGERGKECMVFLTFQANVKGLTAFFHHLIEDDPLARIDSLLLRKEEETGRLSVELMLGKAMP